MSRRKVADPFDREIQADAASGRLDRLAEATLADLRNGRATTLSKVPFMPSPFAPRGDYEVVETGTAFSPKFDVDGLILAIASDADTNEVLMVAYMNTDALARTIETRDAWFWSRSRRTLWRKGEDSGNTLAVVELRVDCDQDALLLKVRMAGDGLACHRGYRSCFYRAIPLGEVATPDLRLGFDTAMPHKLVGKPSGSAD